MNFMSFKGNDEERVMHLESGNIKIMITDKADEFIKKLFNHFCLGIELGWKH